MFAQFEEKLLDDLLNDLENDKLVLPTLPEVALKVRETLENEDAGLQDVAKVITTDAALSARLIQVANSPLLRASREIESVDAAVMRMGAEMVRNLVMSIAMEQMFQATSDATDRRLRALWEHSTEVAAIAHALSSQFTKLKSDNALLAGLVHDIGSLPILSRAEDVPELLEDEALLDRIIQKAHTTVGEAILAKWNFSDEIVAVAAEHETLDRQHEGPADLVDLVMVANLQSHLGTDHPHTQVDWDTIPAFAKLGLQPDISVVDMDETNEAIQAARNALAS